MQYPSAALPSLLQNHADLASVALFDCLDHRMPDALTLLTHSVRTWHDWEEWTASCQLYRMPMCLTTCLYLCQPIEIKRMETTKCLDLDVDCMMQCTFAWASQEKAHESANGAHDLTLLLYVVISCPQCWDLDKLALRNLISCQSHRTDLAKCCRRNQEFSCLLEIVHDISGCVILW